MSASTSTSGSGVGGQLGECERQQAGGGNWIQGVAKYLQYIRRTSCRRRAYLWRLLAACWLCCVWLRLTRTCASFYISRCLVTTRTYWPRDSAGLHSCTPHIHTLWPDISKHRRLRPGPGLGRRRRRKLVTTLCYLQWIGKNPQPSSTTHVKYFILIDTFIYWLFCLARNMSFHNTHYTSQRQNHCSI